jgi:hypothetical protein
MLWMLYDSESGLIRKRLGPSLRLPTSIPDGSVRVALAIGYEDDPAAQAGNLKEALKKGRILETRPGLMKLGDVPEEERYGLEYLDRGGGPPRREELLVPRRRRALRSLDKETLDDFIAVEEPSGGIDGQYTTVTATLRLGARYPDALAQLASRIVTDGEDHYNHFRDIALVLKDNGWDESLEHLRSKPGTKDGLREVEIREAGKANTLYRKILTDLSTAYREGDVRGDRFKIAEARKLMADLEAEAETLAGDPADPKGIPFFDIADKWAKSQGSDLPDSCPPPRRSDGASAGA